MANAISRDDLLSLPLRRYTGAVHLVQTASDLDQAMRVLRRERVAGFDTETRPTFRKGESHRPGLAQFATAQAVYLFRLQQTDCAEALSELLSSAQLVKAGIALADDLRQLKQVFPFHERNVMDLGMVAQRHGLKQTGLRNLAGLFLGFRLTKGPRTSNWDRPQLSAAQIAYAATDAWACRELYFTFEQRGWLTPQP